jgi:polysaccharide export outer membrane protein
MIDDAKMGTRKRVPSARRIRALPLRRPWGLITFTFLLLMSFLQVGPFGIDWALADEAPPPVPPTSQEDNEYQIGPGDVLEIMVWKEPDISRTVTVRLDGKISLPLVDDIQAANSTPLQVKDRITKALRGYVDAPAVYVMLLEARSKKIYVIGKVNSPGEKPLEKHMSLLQAISMAGGFADWADTNDIVIIRKGPKGQTRMKVDYRRAVSGKDMGQNILLQPDDVIVVP